MAVGELDVFVNVPFDDRYQQIFHAIVYAIIRSGYRVRCALEVDDGSSERFSKICSIIAQCRFGIHDISRTETDGVPPLPRFNMPLELGLFLGAKRFGGRDQKGKACLILDTEQHRFRKFISDISGQDIHSHGNTAKAAVKEVSAWLRGQPGGVMPGGGDAVWKEYQTFRKAALPSMCAALKLKVDEVNFVDLNSLVTEYVLRLQ